MLRSEGEERDGRAGNGKGGQRAGERAVCVYGRRGSVRRGRENGPDTEAKEEPLLQHEGGREGGVSKLWGKLGGREVMCVRAVCGPRGVEWHWSPRGPGLVGIRSWATSVCACRSKDIPLEFLLLLCTSYHITSVVHQGSEGGGGNVLQLEVEVFHSHASSLPPALLNLHVLVPAPYLFSPPPPTFSSSLSPSPPSVPPFRSLDRGPRPPVEVSAVEVKYNGQN